MSHSRSAILRITKSAALILLGVVWSVAAASASEKLPACGNFSLSGGKFDVHVIDIDGKGDNLGDKRIGRRSLLDSDGKVVGHFRWIAHIVAIDKGNSTLMHGRYIYILPDGTLHADGQFTFKRATDGRMQPLNANAIAVVGGTGAYARSRGEIDGKFTPGKPSRYNFKLHCG